MCPFRIQWLLVGTFSGAFKCTLDKLGFIVGPGNGTIEFSNHACLDRSDSELSFFKSLLPSRISFQIMVVFSEFQIQRCVSFNFHAPFNHIYQLYNTMLLMKTSPHRHKSNTFSIYITSNLTSQERHFPAIHWHSSAPTCYNLSLCNHH